MARFLIAAIVVVMTIAVRAAPPARAAGKGIDGVVNLNTAPPEALALLPGIGPAKVEAIILYRRRRPFRTVDELVRIKGIGRRMVRALRPHLAVAGPTTASALAIKRRFDPAALAALEQTPAPAAATAAARPPPGAAASRAPSSSSTPATRGPHAVRGPLPGRPAARGPPPQRRDLPLAARRYCLGPP